MYALCIHWYSSKLPTSVKYLKMVKCLMQCKLVVRLALYSCSSGANWTGVGCVKVTGIFPPGKFSTEGSTPVVSPRNIPPMKSMHGNNVVWLCAKYAIDANLFRLESSILTRARRVANRNNVGGEHSLGAYTGVERSGGKYTSVYLQNRFLLLSVKHYVNCWWYEWAFRCRI